MIKARSRPKPGLGLGGSEPGRLLPRGRGSARLADAPVAAAEMRQRQSMLLNEISGACAPQPPILRNPSGSRASASAWRPVDAPPKGTTRHTRAKCRRYRVAIPPIGAAEPGNYLPGQTHRSRACGGRTRAGRGFPAPPGRRSGCAGRGRNEWSCRTGCLSRRWIDFRKLDRSQPGSRAAPDASTLLLPDHRN